MSADPPTLRAIDAVALRRSLRRIAALEQPPWLHGEVARRMAERLPLVRLQPSVVVDWWSGIGASSALLKAQYPKATLQRVEPPLPRRDVPRERAPRWWHLGRARDTAPARDAAAVPDAAAQLLWANMMLHAVPDPVATMAQWHRVLTVDGFLMFSTFGPDTLKALRTLYRDVGFGVPHAPFVDMHDLGDMLVAAGFADPVMDQEVLRLTWAAPAALLAELRTLGANADLARHPGLRTPRWRTRLEQALAGRAGADGRIALEFEIVYGHAFKPAPRAPVAAETRVSPAELQRMARRGRLPG
jgi:malonyl-CoA O-methyltransferase